MAQGSPGGPGHPRPERLDTGGRVLGWVGVVIAVGLVVAYLSELRGPDPLPVELLTGSVFAGVLFWAVILRPRVLVTSDVLVLRNMLETTRIPLAAVEHHALRQVLVVRAGEKKYVAAGVGRSRRATATRRGGRGDARASTTGRVLGGGAGSVVDAADFVDERITHLARDARDRAGVAHRSDEQVALGRTVRREPAWPVIGVLVLTFALFALSFAL